MEAEKTLPFIKSDLKQVLSSPKRRLLHLGSENAVIPQEDKVLDGFFNAVEKLMQNDEGTLDFKLHETRKAPVAVYKKEGLPSIQADIPVEDMLPKITRDGEKDYIHSAKNFLIRCSQLLTQKGISEDNNPFIQPVKEASCASLQISAKIPENLSSLNTGNLFNLNQNIVKQNLNN